MPDVATIMAKCRAAAATLGVDYDPHDIVDLELEAIEVEFYSTPGPSCDRLIAMASQYTDMLDLRAELLRRGITPRE